MFREWRNGIVAKVRDQLSGRDYYGFNSVLNDEEVILALDQLHSEFVLVPTDKASNNVTIVCKKFYVSLIQKELTSSNFIVDTRSGDDIIKEHSVFLSRFGIAMLDSNKKLPSLYYTPKQHKNPVGFRMITSGNNCSSGACPGGGNAGGRRPLFEMLTYNFC